MGYLSKPIQFHKIPKKVRYVFTVVYETKLSAAFFRLPVLFSNGGAHFPSSAVDVPKNRTSTALHHLTSLAEGLVQARGLIGFFHYLRSIMKKTVRYLFLVALLFTVAGAFAVSCQKGGEEEENIDGASSGNMPIMQPKAQLRGNTYLIMTDGTIISAKSSGYSYDVRAEAITFRSFACLLNRNETFSFSKDCNLTLTGGSTFTLINGGHLSGRHVTLSGNGSITIKKINLNVTFFDDMFSAAEGYTLTSSGKVDEGNNLYSCTWTVDKSK